MDAVNYISPFHSKCTAEVIMSCSYLQYVYTFKPLTTAKGSISSDGKLKKILQKFTFVNLKMLQISKYSNSTVSCKKENNSPTHWCWLMHCRITETWHPWRIIQLLRGNCRIIVPPFTWPFMKTPTEYFVAAAGKLFELCSSRKILLLFCFSVLIFRNVNGLRNLESFLSVQNLKKDHIYCFWVKHR